MSCCADKYICLDTLKIKIHPLLMQWASAVELEEILQMENRERRTDKPVTEAPLIFDRLPG